MPWATLDGDRDGATGVRVRVPGTRAAPVPEYPGHYLVKKVATAGTFRLQHKLLDIVNALVDQHIGLDETDDGVWSIFFNTVLIATVDERDYIIRG